MASSTARDIGPMSPMTEARAMAKAKAVLGGTLVSLAGGNVGLEVQDGYVLVLDVEYGSGWHVTYATDEGVYAEPMVRIGWIPVLALAGWLAPYLAA